MKNLILLALIADTVLAPPALAQETSSARAVRDTTSDPACCDEIVVTGRNFVVADKPVVIDRNRMTGGCVTAGIKCGLTLAAHLDNEEAARWLPLIIVKYAPEPPFLSVAPQESGPRQGVELTGRTPWMNGEVDAAVPAGAKRLGIAA